MMRWLLRIGNICLNVCFGKGFECTNYGIAHDKSGIYFDSGGSYAMRIGR
jgi:hypothetical protein